MVRWRWGGERRQVKLDLGDVVTGAAARPMRPSFEARASDAGACRLRRLAGDDKRAGAGVDPDELLRSKVMATRKLVSVVDDDESVRESLPDLLRSFGFDVAPFASAEAFLASDSLNLSSCLILDVAMPGMTGPELQKELIGRGYVMPIIFITAHSEDRMLPIVMERGAVACLYKPLNVTALLEAVHAALGSSEAG
jgi:CheY-like chemotaxis protein